MEPDTTLPKGHFFYSDGGGIKIYGRSYPVIKDTEVFDNYASPCAGGVSVERYGQRDDDNESVTLENCVFRNNRARVMGAAVDLLPGTSTRIINCLLVGNAANMGTDYLAPEFGFPPGTNSAVLTVFNPARLLVKNCTFTGNRNGVDDRNTNSVYSYCIFWKNNLEAGLSGGKRYEMDIIGRAKVSGCFFGGAVRDPSNSISPQDNVLDAPSPDLGELFAPRAPVYKNVGYQPVTPRSKAGLSTVRHSSLGSGIPYPSSNSFQLSSLKGKTYKYVVKEVIKPAHSPDPPAVRCESHAATRPEPAHRSIHSSGRGELRRTGLFARDSQIRDWQRCS